MNLDLSGKRAVVCGSTQGIGKAAAMELAQMGASITLVARNESKLEAVCRELANNGSQKHEFICADFGNPTDLNEKITAYAAVHKDINILVNNTGGPAAGPITDAKLEAFQSAFTNHLMCNHVMVQALAPVMQLHDFGRIINVISTSVKIPLTGLGVSNTIRGAVASWSKTLANELGKHNITVNNVLPGATNTVRLQSIIESKAGKTGQTIDAVGAAMAAQVPMGRVAEAEEVANAIAFLASPAASYINGVSIPVDGGRTGSI